MLFQHTYATVAMQWQIPVVSGMNSAKISAFSRKERQIITGDSAERELALLQAFSVSPLTAEINPGKSASFEAKVYFRTKTNNHFMRLRPCVKIVSVYNRLLCALCCCARCVY
jgi:hypothetical protein